MSDAGDKVVFLAHRSPEQVESGRDLLACANCRNKTFLHVCDKPSGFPLAQCAACGQHIGRIGWADSVDDAPSPDDPGGGEPIPFPARSA
jgi:hypothetical protein